MMQLLRERLPAGVELPVIAALAVGAVGGSMQYDFETVAVHPPALVSGGNVGQPVGRFEAITAPDLRMTALVEFDPGISPAADSDPGGAREPEARADPARQVGVARVIEYQVELPVIERCDAGLQQRLQLPDTRAGETFPVRRQLRPNTGPETVTMHALRRWQRAQLARGLEAASGGMEQSLSHG